MTQGLTLERATDRWTFRVTRLSLPTVTELLDHIIEAQQTDVPTLIFQLRCGATEPEPSRGQDEFVEVGQLACQMISRAGKFTVASLETDTFHEAFEIALACHVRMARPGIRVGFPGSPSGRLPRWGGTSRLARAIGKDRALRLLTLSPELDAVGALEVGILDEIADGDELSRKVDEICEGVAIVDPVSRSLLIRNLGIGEGDALTLDRFEAFHDRLISDEYRPHLEYVDSPSPYLRREDARRNFSVLLDRDQERGLLDQFETDQVEFLLEQLLESKDLEIRGRVLELGAGSCWLSATLSRLPEVSEVVALELSDNEVLLKAPVGLQTFEADMSKMKFLVGNFNAAGFTPGSFDTVVFARALHHSNDARASLVEAHRLLRTGGTLIGFQEHISPRFLSPARRKVKARRTTVELTLPEYRQLFQEVGFRFRAVPYFVDNYRRFLGITFNDRYLVQYTPRRLLNSLLYGRYHLLGVKA
jgi:enoyl-CoA hydratase/carnithine racemase